MIYVYIQNKRFMKQISYVFDIMFKVLGLEYSYLDPTGAFKENEKDIIIGYLDDHAADCGILKCFRNIIIIKNSGGLFNDNYMNTICLPCNVKRYVLKKAVKGIYDIVSLYNPSEELYIKQILNKKRIVWSNIDIISDSFFMLSRYEEVMQPELQKKEKYGRFPAEKSAACKNGFILRPVVNEYIELLWSFIKEIIPDYKRRSLWGDKEFAACLTHDVDSVRKYGSVLSGIRAALGTLLKFKNPRQAYKNILNFIEARRDFRKDPYWTFEYIAETEGAYKFTSSFYFLSGEGARLDGNYSIEDKNICRLIMDLENKGFEAGYHGSFNSFNDLEIMKSEKQRLYGIIGEKPCGCRQHYLRFKMPDTLENQQGIGMLYDTTLAFAEQEGFRCGICFPYRPYDLVRDRVLDIWEIPPAAMDFTFMNPRYRGLSPVEGFEQTKHLIDTVRKYNGVFTLLWHNTSFDNGGEDWRRLFEKTMSYLSESSCCGTNGRNLINILSS